MSSTFTRSLICAFLFLDLARVASSAEPPPSREERLHIEVEALMQTLGWPRMVDIALKRGDLQHVAKVALTDHSPAALDCVDARYRAPTVLSRIAIGYELVYQDPDLVAETAKYLRDPAFQKVLDRVAARAPDVGASAAYEEGKPNVWSGLTETEREQFREFVGARAGKFYLTSKAQLLRVNQGQLSELAREIAAECSR